MLYTNQLYTFTEIMTDIGATTQRLSGDNLVHFCENMGLYIEKADEKKRNGFLYRIIKNNTQIENEEWKPIYCNDFLEVSNLGRARKITTKCLVGHKVKDGYIMIPEKRSGTARGYNKQMFAHRAIYFTFHPEALDHSADLIIDHINGIRDDNRLDNLRAISSHDNMTHKIDNNRPLQELLGNYIIQYGYDTVREKLEHLFDAV